MPRMRIQAQIVEESNLEQRKRKRRKVKVRKRKRRTTRMVECMEFPRRYHGKKRTKKQESKTQKNKRIKERNEAEIQHADKGLFSEWNSWPV